MADKQVYIDNGDTLGWDTQIIISADGVNWSSFPKIGMKVMTHQVDYQTMYPGSVSADRSGDVIVLKNVADDSTYARFHIEDVANQPGWTTTALALNDINMWLI